ncbi:serine hydrolase domain-containing protein [Martelella soudanensis]|uniref:serine hydrolase domain-containing protein n=1 Tax=unclassified Martelella TaxID=2629616 RepID=UPI0015DEEF64|nr:MULTISPECIES: serine hydrolase domain-containing protein [unclassified Martelella]
MSEIRFDKAFSALERSVAAGRIPGGVLGWIDLEGRRLTRGAGRAAIVPEERQMTIDTWFDLASLTKVIFTTPRILALAEAGEIDLDAPLTSVIPDFRQYDPNCWERQVTFRQCLGHQTHFPAVEPIYTYGGDPDRLRAFVLQREWRRVETPVYSDINFILLGIALERLSGDTIRDLKPGPGFAFSAEPAKTVATERCTWRGRVIAGEVHDENCYALQGSGHAGLFGQVDAVLGFARDLLKRDNRDDAAVRLMREPLSERRTHGWERPYEGWHGGALCSQATIGHTGFTGTSLVVDFERGHAWTLLTNRVHPSRHVDSGIMALRRAVSDFINGAE